MTDREHEPGEPVPVAGLYEELNLFGSQTGKAFEFREGEPLPRLPRHQTWRLVKRLVSLDAE